jgi:hypothetical protein
LSLCFRTIYWKWSRQNWLVAVFNHRKFQLLHSIFSEVAPISSLDQASDKTKLWTTSPCVSCPELLLPAYHRNFTKDFCRWMLAFNQSIIDISFLPSPSNRSFCWIVGPYALCIILSTLKYSVQFLSSVLIFRKYALWMHNFSKCFVRFLDYRTISFPYTNCNPVGHLVHVIGTMCVLYVTCTNNL